MATRPDASPPATADAEAGGGPRNVVVVELLRHALASVDAPGEQFERLRIA